MGADITLNSYGGLYADSYALQSAIQAAEDKGQLFVTAAGNDYGDCPYDVYSLQMLLSCKYIFSPKWGKVIPWRMHCSRNCVHC